VYDLAFSKYSSYSKPNEILLDILKREPEDVKIVILSARGEGGYDDVVALLDKYTVRYEEILLRKDLSTNDEDWKAQKVVELANGYNEIELYEDKHDNILRMETELRVLGGRINFYLVSDDMIQMVRPAGANR
jgi:hypothetical protein